MFSAWVQNCSWGAAFVEVMTWINGIGMRRLSIDDVHSHTPQKKQQNAMGHTSIKIVQRPMSHCNKNLTAVKPRAHVRELQGAPRAAAGLVPGLVPGHDIATDIMTTM